MLLNVGFRIWSNFWKEDVTWSRDIVLTEHDRAVRRSRIESG